MGELISVYSNLLHNIASVKRLHDEIAKSTGENYNVFRVLNVARDELSHSRFIAHLLNPRATHEMGDLFLELFYETLDLPADRFCISSVQRIRREEMTTEGRRIDIYIEAENYCVSIENKIDAEDQDNQLHDYIKYMKNKKNDFIMIYLTLDGKNASNDSIGTALEDDNKSIINISYREHICEWLVKCMKETTDKPLLRETIKQYLYLIRSITGQSRSREMTTEITDIITNNPLNLMAALEIEKNLKEIKIKLLREFIRELKSNFTENVREIDFEKKLKDFSTGKDYRIDFFAIKILNSQFNNLEFRFRINKDAGLYAGFSVGETKENHDKKFEKIIKHFNFGSKPTDSFINQTVLHLNFDNLDENSIKLVTPTDKMKETAKEIADKCKEYISECQNILK